MWYLDTSITEIPMRLNVHDTTARFRVNAAVLAAAETKAKQQGMSLSEFLRSAVRSSVSRELEDA